MTTTTAPFIATVAAFLGVRPGETPLLYETDTRETAIDTLRRGAHSGGYSVEEYRAGRSTVFLPGKLALIIGDGWAALCTVTSWGRLAAVNDVAVWEGAA